MGNFDYQGGKETAGLVSLFSGLLVLFAYGGYLGTRLV